jgi:hypothetical protein
MADFSKALFLQALDEWARYATTFSRMPAADQTAFLKEQGYASVQDLLAHVAVWWEEARSIIDDAVAKRPHPPREYNFDEFNAAALGRFKDASEAEFAAWYESQRQQMITVVSALSDEQMKIRRVYSWLDGVVLEHLKEHSIDAPRFLIIDMLRREWGDYVGRFRLLSPEKQAAFLKKQGFERFRDLAAHIIAWWEHGIAALESSTNGDTDAAQDVDAFNAEAVARFGRLDEAQVFAEYEQTRLTLIGLVDGLPEQVFSKRNFQTWLRADVLQHYYDHPL